MRFQRPETVSDLEVVFVVGCPRSGTTLLQRILTVHEEFFSIEGETGLFTRQNPFAQRHFGLDEVETRALLDRSRDVVDFFERGVTRLAGGRPGRTFVEKTPQHVLRLGMLLDHFPSAAFVHVLRDGRDCFASSRSHPDVPQSASAAGFARYWDRCVGAADEVDAGERLHTVRYEDLTADPEGEVERLMTFLGRSASEDQLDPEAIGADRRGGLEEFARLRRRITTGSVGRWRHELDASEKATFWRIAGPRLESHGYPRR